MKITPLFHSVSNRLVVQPVCTLIKGMSITASLATPALASALAATCFRKCLELPGSDVNGCITLWPISAREIPNYNWQDITGTMQQVAHVANSRVLRPLGDKCLQTLHSLPQVEISPFHALVIITTLTTLTYLGHKVYSHMTTKPPEQQPEGATK